MILRGGFVFISEQKRESNGRTYYNYNLEFDDGSLERVSGADKLFGTFEKYKRYIGDFRIGTYQGSMYMNLVSAERSKV